MKALKIWCKPLFEKKMEIEEEKVKVKKGIWLKICGYLIFKLINFNLILFDFQELKIKLKSSFFSQTSHFFLFLNSLICPYLIFLSNPVIFLPEPILLSEPPELLKMRNSVSGLFLGLTVEFKGCFRLLDAFLDPASQDLLFEDV